jgi:L,D-peptidoglycan transpeptidase YkuD (ErfK/YbiS/YcfS/YnhG family)
MDLRVNSTGTADWNNHQLRCAIGRSGIAAAKREGDGATPAGRFAMRFVLYRPDRGPLPPTALPCRALDEQDGWCDDPADPLYNRLIRLPYPASAEGLWRTDAQYDLIVPLGYNDLPVVPGRGSAIFLHLAAPDFSPTAGCVALARADLLMVLAMADSRSRVVITP